MLTAPITFPLTVTVSNANPTGVITTTVTTASPSPTLNPYPPGTNPVYAGNVYQGALRYIDPDYAALIQASTNAANDATYTSKAVKVAQQPTFIWLDSTSSVSSIQRHLSAAAAQANGQPIVAEFVVYNLPGRECWKQYPNWEIAPGNLSTYQSFIDNIATVFSSKSSNVYLSLIIEPRSLQITCQYVGLSYCTQQVADDYLNGIAYAIEKLSNNPNNRNVTIRGWASNVRGYDPFSAPGVCPAKAKCPLQNGMYDYSKDIDEKSYIADIGTKMAAAGLPNNWIHDTSRNGRAGIRNDWQSWCNVKGSGIGPRPQTEPAPNVDAFVWAWPPGLTDGASPRGPDASGWQNTEMACDYDTVAGEDALNGAPAYGKWFDNMFQIEVINVTHVPVHADPEKGNKTSIPYGGEDGEKGRQGGQKDMEAMAERKENGKNGGVGL
ncbi:hypothetical protein HDV00_007140 [Rhizophlyctis rosea]|nr:hypothetical protein HDV00_007140 [Rhizophlyctis rosea]